MYDRTAEHPGRVRLAPVAGQEYIYDMTMADEPVVEGTPPTKNNLLTNETAEELGLTEAATVNEALAKLYTLMNPVPVTRGGTGKKTASAGLAALIGGGAPMQKWMLTSGDYIGLNSQGYSGSGGRITLAILTEWLHDTGGLSMAKVGSYTGTGTRGSSNPCTLTFDFEPKLVLIQDGAGTLILIRGSGSASINKDGALYSESVTWDENSVSWYVSNARAEGGTGSYNDLSTNPAYQLNKSGTVYPYVVIG